MATTRDPLTGQKFTDSAGHVYQATLLSGEDQTNDVLVVEQGQFGYETVAASQTLVTLGTTGAAGDFLHCVIVDTAGTVTLVDGATTVLTITSTGVYPINAVATTAWRITTAAASSCMCIGRFS